MWPDGFEDPSCTLRLVQVSWRFGIGWISIPLVYAWCWGNALGNLGCGVFGGVTAMIILANWL